MHRQPAPLIRRSANCNAGAGLAIVTVTHNSAPQLAALLRSVAAHLPEAQVVVADCASGDGSVAVGRAAGARVLALGENVGFGTACNRALGEVDVPACALLNPDIELLDASLAELASTAAGSRRLLAPLILSADGSRQDTVHPLPGSGAELLRALLPYTRLPLRATAPWNARQPRRVGWAIGAALVASTALLHELGPFDERIFMYAEDLDLALRARSAGVETWFDPRGRVLHHGAHSTAAAYGGEPTELLIRSRRTVVARRLGRPALARDDGAAAVRFAGRIAVRRLLGRPAAREWAQLRALCDG
jgi:N-acetylglucosaminyl-diphospho-decaprenol L-rhamnosyltransferase